MRSTRNPHTQNRRMRHPKSSWYLSSVPPKIFLGFIVCATHQTRQGEQPQFYPVIFLRLRAQLINTSKAFSYSNMCFSAPVSKMASSFFVADSKRTPRL